jgi:DivIVA domain-containing protein
MPLTPEDVSNKRFTPVRLREGYDMGEVDQFLDEVEAELERLTKDNEDLRTKLSAAQQGGSSQAAAPLVATPEAQTPPEPEVTTPEPEPIPEPEPEPIAPVESQAVQVTNATPEAGVQTIRVETVADASNAAARLLELASRNADQLVDGAKGEADKIIGEARTKAERLESESKTNADQLEAEARGRAQMLDTETADRRTQLF